MILLIASLFFRFPRSLIYLTNVKLVAVYYHLYIGGSVLPFGGSVLPFVHWWQCTTICTLVAVYYHWWQCTTLCTLVNYEPRYPATIPL